MDEIEIIPLRRPLDARIRVPGSKSITNRALLLAAMASGRSVIDGALLSDDTRYMSEALRVLDYEVEPDKTESRITVDGLGGRILSRGAELYVGGAGTAMRFLAPFLTLGEARFRIDGNQRMRERPMGPLLAAMEQLGATVCSERGNQCPPVIVDASRGRLAGGAAEVDARLSSQFVSALLLPAPLWCDGLRLKVAGQTARPFIDMTLKLMRAWGAESRVDGDTIAIAGGQQYRAQLFAVEPDASNASYFAAAAALAGGRVLIEGLARDSVQGDTEFLGVLESMGARVKWSAAGVEVTGTGTLRGVDVPMTAMPDMVATLVALAPFASFPTRISGVGFIRHHESDRLHALATELRRLGATVEEGADGLVIAPSALHGASVETYDDHRIAMSLAVIGLKVPGVRIKDPSCVSKTFPDFFERLSSLSSD